MRLSVVKDKVLKRIHESKGTISSSALSEFLAINEQTVIAALVELRDGGYITLLEVSGRGYGNKRSYIVDVAEAKGVHFVESGKKFRKIEINEWVKNMPKNYWFLGSFIALIATQSSLIVQLFYKSKPEKPKIELQVKRGIKSDTIIVYQK